MLRAIRSCRNEGQVDIGRGCGRQFLLGLFSRFFQTLHGHLVAGEVNAFLALEFLDHPVDHLVVEVIATEHRVTVRGKHFDDAVADIDDGHIEGAAAKVVHHDLLFFFIVQAVSKSCRGRFVDDTLDFKTRDLAGILGCLTLCIIEVRRHRDYGFRYAFTQIAFRVRFQLLQDHCRDFLRRIVLAVDRSAVVGAHFSLDRGNGAVGVGHSLTLGRFTDQTFSGLGKCHDTGGRAHAFIVRDNDGFAAFHDCYAAVCCT